MPRAAASSPEQTLAAWTLRYFLSHGPAQPKDFAWWSGLTLQEAQRGIELAKGSLLRDTIEGRTYWRSPGGDGQEPTTAESRVPAAGLFCCRFMTSTPSPTGTAAPWAPSATWSA